MLVRSIAQASFRWTTEAFKAFSKRSATKGMATAVSTNIKRNMVKLGTHSGTFHCDEALGCFLLRRTEQFRDADIVRTRDADTLKDLDVIIDVGGEYDAATYRFDHHQRGFTEVFGHGFSTKLSSAGLCYKHFGEQIVAAAMGLPVSHPDVRTVYLAVYKNFMESIDAIDNGVNQFDSDLPPKYVNNTHLSSRVGKLNPAWNEESSDEELMRRFLKAVELTGSEFMESVNYYAKSWLPARSFVKQSLEQRHEADPSGEIVKLVSYGPWKEHLYELEQELNVEKPIKFVLYEDDREKKWRVQAVSVAPGSFDNRKALATAWRGLRGDDLSRESGIPGCVFVHISGFIGGNDTYEGALAMAQKSLVLP